MSEPDPMDKAYAQAEALLADEAARAARRARVLAAVADTAPERAAPSRRPAWRRGGWLVAAGVAGVSVLLATQIRSPVATEPPAAPAAPMAPIAPAAVPASQGVAAPAPVAERAEAPPPPQAPVVADAAPATAPAMAAAKVAPPPPPPRPPPAVEARARLAPPPPAPAPALAAPPADDSLQELVVTGSRIEQPRAAARSAAAAAKASPGQLDVRLREAAAQGRTAEVATLLARGAPVDAADDEGNTALMKSIEGRQAAVAALLRRRGASLDRKNHAGVSARDLAAALDDAALNRALRLGE